MDDHPSARIQNLLASSKPAIWIVMLWLGVLGIVSLVMFLFQSQYRDPFGDYFRDQPGAWLHLFGHFLRSVIGLTLAVKLWRLLNAIGRFVSRPESENADLHERLRSWWVNLSGCLLALTGFAIIAVLRSDDLRSAQAKYSETPLEKFSASSPEESTTADPVKVEFRLAEFRNSDGLEEMPVGQTGTSTYLHPRAVMTNEDILETRVAQTIENDLRLDVTFTQPAAERMREIANQHQNKPLAILIDGKVLMAPVIRGPIGDKASLNGFVNRSEAERIAKGITARK